MLKKIQHDNKKMIYVPARSRKRFFLRTFVYWISKLFKRRRRTRQPTSTRIRYASTVALSSYGVHPVTSFLFDSPLVRKSIGIIAFTSLVVATIYMAYSLLPKQIVSPLPKSPPVILRFSQ